MDIWDLKPDAPTGGPFKPISTTGDVQISEHMPLMAKQMHNMAIVRSMSTREADHMRAFSIAGCASTSTNTNTGIGTDPSHFCAANTSIQLCCEATVGP